MKKNLLGGEGRTSGGGERKGIAGKGNCVRRIIRSLSTLI